MHTINLDIPIDNSFTNLAIYEGLLFMLNNVSAEYNPMSIKVKDNSFTYCYKSLDATRLSDDKNNRRRLLLRTAGINDNRPLLKLLNNFSISVESKINRYQDLLKLLRKHANKLTLDKDINIMLNIKKDLFIGDITSKEEGYSLQLFKMERYTGITSTELDYTTEQLTTYFSKEALLIALLGIYSSFIAYTRENNNTYYYFLFFMPDEIMKMLNKDMDIETAFLIKDKIIDILNEVLSKHYGEELLIMEIMIDARIQDLLKEYNIDKISLILFRVASEGQTYKIYQQIPLIVHKKDLSEIHNELARLLEPDRLILRRLSNNKNPEYNNLISAIIATYRFVILNDKQGLFLLMRELYNAYNKLISSKEHKKIGEYYANVLRSLGNKVIRYA